MARAVLPLMLAAGGGRVVNISMNEETMTRRGFVPYGPAGAGVEAPRIHSLPATSSARRADDRDAHTPPDRPAP